MSKFTKSRISACIATILMSSNHSTQSDDADRITCSTDVLLESRPGKQPVAYVRTFNSGKENLGNEKSNRKASWYSSPYGLVVQVD
jgi:hypothetical protein